MFAIDLNVFKMFFRTDMYPFKTPNLKKYVPPSARKKGAIISYHPL